MSRSIWKGVITSKKEKKIKRDITITPEDVGKTIKIHMGMDINRGTDVTITTQHIGHKYGEYAITKIPAVYKRNSNKK